MKKYHPDGRFASMSRDEVRAFDSRAVNELGIPGAVLMENAGRSCAELIIEKLSGKTNAQVCLFCGTGNNGGDGFVIARHLLNHGVTPLVVICGRRSKIKGDAALNLNIIERLNIRIEQLARFDIRRIAELAENACLIVDAIFGTGLTGALHNEYMELLEKLNGLNCPILAVDIPSGLDCDTGVPLGAAIKAAWTVTFVAMKKGFLSDSAQLYTGEIYVASIGIEPQ